jgi:hypothetical protein
MLAYGTSVDQLDEVLKIAASTCLEILGAASTCLEILGKIAEGVIENLKNIYTLQEAMKWKKSYEKMRLVVFQECWEASIVCIGCDTQLNSMVIL